MADLPACLATHMLAPTVVAAHSGPLWPVDDRNSYTWHPELEHITDQLPTHQCTPAYVGYATRGV
eukprot:4034905-Alexandrium_andersonii.AAC.1